MNDFREIFISGTTIDEFCRAVTKAIQQLPVDVGRQLHQIRRHYFAKYGIEGEYKMMNGRTVAQIIAEYDPRKLNVIVSGERDGVRYELHEAPGAVAKESETSGGG